jgi:tRNA threonylcarbamoyl adenosine modification protein YeaZ
MKILGIEWSSSHRTLAIGEWSSDAGVRILATAILSGGRDSKYFDAFRIAAEQAGIQKGDIEAVVVGLGPGSYAGIRSGISVAYGWHLANRASLIGIPSARVIARKAFAEKSVTRVHTLIDAQRGECYHAIFERQKDGSLHIIKRLALIHPDQLPCPEADNEIFAGSGMQRWFQGESKKGDSILNVSPDAATLIHEAECSLHLPSSNILEPIYLRPTSFVKAPPPRILLKEDEANNDVNLES